MIPDAPPQPKITVRRDGSFRFPWTVRVGQGLMIPCQNYDQALVVARAWSAAA